MGYSSLVHLYIKITNLRFFVFDKVPAWEVSGKSRLVIISSNIKKEDRIITILSSVIVYNI